MVRKNVSIIQFDTAGEEIKRWNLTGAYPINWKGPAFKTNSKKAALETLQLVHRGLALDGEGE